MLENTITRFQYILDNIPPFLREIDEATFSAKPDPAKWSKKEIIGHLIDSAANNHQRFVRAQFEEAPLIKYDQNKWNEHSYYQARDSRQLIDFWVVYNQQLLQLIRHLPIEFLDKTLYNGGEKPVTLQFVIVDYVAHLEHHLKQIINY